MVDEIVEEIRTHRELHAAKFNYNLRTIYEDLKKSEIERIKMGHPCIETVVGQVPTNKSLHRTTAAIPAVPSDEPKCHCLCGF